MVCRCSAGISAAAGWQQRVVAIAIAVVIVVDE